MLSVPATHTNGPSQLGVAVVDAWKAMEGPSNNRGDYLSDGLHLNAR
jgi:lysophospholipase L1-like esterase